jgi:hypothetical protein
MLDRNQADFEVYQGMIDLNASSIAGADVTAG